MEGVNKGVNQYIAFTCRAHAPNTVKIIEYIFTTCNLYISNSQKNRHRNDGRLFGNHTSVRFFT